jgi:catechol 2,3-dioxygenase-like lactoylglutathione lyase family enzyme
MRAQGYPKSRRGSRRRRRARGNLAASNLEETMIDHTGVSVSDAKKSRHFYEKALEPLGYKVLMEVPIEFTGGAMVIGLGEAPKPDFWVNEGPPQIPHVHIAFRAKSRAEVDAFYRAALAAGGFDNGPPGLRPHYHPHYYGAFVKDPDGHNIEAVTHDPE